MSERAKKLTEEIAELARERDSLTVEILDNQMTTNELKAQLAAEVAANPVQVQPPVLIGSSVSGMAHRAFERQSRHGHIDHLAVCREPREVYLRDVRYLNEYEPVPLCSFCFG